ncbi:unnamed protein product [Periconia digitata]|uniref:Uncharacterized protein n=1 Tax=Periconia digitata TaxID=1303443 RepID=A0A9W4XCX4_9PLEO|nr:unnamed protein product [Periconia digitata]
MAVIRINTTHVYQKVSFHIHEQSNSHARKVILRGDNHCLISGNLSQRICVSLLCEKGKRGEAEREIYMPSPRFALIQMRWKSSPRTQNSRVRAIPKRIPRYICI